MKQMMQALGPDTICNIVAFVATGAECVALVTADRRMRATLKGPLARKHFRDMSVMRWGEGCRCHYYADLGSKSGNRGDSTVTDGRGDDTDRDGSTRESNANANTNAANVNVVAETISNTGTENSNDTNKNANTNSDSDVNTSSSTNATACTNINTNANPNSGNSANTTKANTNTNINDKANDSNTANANTNTNTNDEATRSEDSGDWLAFYLRRMGHRPATASPLNLLQERYADDAYRLLSCCILCSRTSGGKAVKDSVEKFFDMCPTPSSVVSADVGELRETLLPLGLNREIAIKRFAQGFLTHSWSDPSELHGCGRFASDSWQIFCLGRTRPKHTLEGGGGGKGKKNRRGKQAALDRNLAAYCRFAESRGGRGEGGRGDGGGGERRERVRGGGGGGGGGEAGGGRRARGERAKGGGRGRMLGKVGRLEDRGGLGDDREAAGAGPSKRTRTTVSSEASPVTAEPTISPREMKKKKTNQSPATRKNGKGPPPGGVTREDGGVDAGLGIGRNGRVDGGTRGVTRKQGSKRASVGRGGSAVGGGREDGVLRRSSRGVAGRAS
eukprot:jgi/Undpi1/1906/HiC_scaffold_12.g05293.m1